MNWSRLWLQASRTIINIGFFWKSSAEKHFKIFVWDKEPHMSFISSMRASIVSFGQWIVFTATDFRSPMRPLYTLYLSSLLIFWRLSYSIKPCLVQLGSCSNILYAPDWLTYLNADFKCMRPSTFPVIMSNKHLDISDFVHLEAWKK